MGREPLHNEEVLLRRIADGDEAAFESIFDHYWDQVYGTALRLTKSPEQSKDLAQDIFFKLWANRTKLAELNGLGNYLFIIARNTVYDYLRNKVFKESNRQYLAEYISYTQHSPQDIVEQKELDRTVLDAIDRLPPQLQQVFRLRRIDGLSHEEIGRRLNISPMSSKTYMVRALALIRAQLGKNGETAIILLIVSLKYYRF